MNVRKIRLPAAAEFGSTLSLSLCLCLSLSLFVSFVEVRTPLVKFRWEISSRRQNKERMSRVSMRDTALSLVPPLHSILFYTYQASTSVCEYSPGFPSMSRSVPSVLHSPVHSFRALFRLKINIRANRTLGRVLTLINIVI